MGTFRGKAANGKNVIVKICLKRNLKMPHASAGNHNTNSSNGSPKRVNPRNDVDVNPNRKRKVQ